MLMQIAKLKTWKTWKKTSTSWNRTANAQQIDPVIDKNIEKFNTQTKIKREGEVIDSE